MEWKILCSPYSCPCHGIRQINLTLLLALFDIFSVCCNSDKHLMWSPIARMIIYPCKISMWYGNLNLNARTMFLYCKMKTIPGSYGMCDCASHPHLQLYHARYDYIYIYSTNMGRKESLHLQDLTPRKFLYDLDFCGFTFTVIPLRVYNGEQCICQIRLVVC